MIALANLFLIGFALDGAISVLDDLARAGLLPVTLSVVRAGIALTVLLAAIANFFALAIDPRLPKRILLPLIAFLVWSALGAYPLPVGIGASQANGMALSGIQLGLGLGALSWIRLRSATRRWLLDASDLPRKRRRIGYTLRFAAATALIAPPLLAGLAGLSMLSQIERATAGFMTFDLAGINSTSREYHREDRRIDLVGMAHIGEDAAYRDLFGSFAGESTLLLEEGVSDEDGLIREGLFYEAFADRIGLGVQPRFEDLRAARSSNDAVAPWPDIRNADVDARVFADDTIAVLDAAARLYGSDRIAPALSEFQAELDELGPDATQAAFRDLIENRNAHLLDEIRAGLDDYHRIVVPWGALHMPGIEDAILGWGFEQTASSQRQITAYQTILAALLSRSEAR
jgi:hypothetical protein